MQLADSNKCNLAGKAKREKGAVEMPVGESITLASIGKWLIGLVLAPWLWHERKRLDELKSKISEDHFTKTETREEILNKTDTLNRDMTEVKETTKIISDNIVTMGVTIARMDERSKKKNNG